MPSVLELEDIAFRMWPAAEVEPLSGWRLRATHGVTRRANSVWASSIAAGLEIEERLERVERWYRARGLPARYQITSACEPPDLDRRLGERGYGVEAPSTVQTVELDGFRMAGQPPQILTSVLAEPSAEWTRLTIDHGRSPSSKDAYLGILGRVTNRGGFALARWKGKAVAAGVGVLDGDWLGVFGMMTLPEARRRRAGTAILGALVAWAAARGAKSALLQVEKDNGPAGALYAACGFVDAYPYHYRTQVPGQP